MIMTSHVNTRITMTIFQVFVFYLVFNTPLLDKSPSLVAWIAVVVCWIVDLRHAYSLWLRIVSNKQKQVYDDTCIHSSLSYLLYSSAHNPSPKMVWMCYTLQDQRFIMAERRRTFYYIGLLHSLDMRGYYN